MIAATRVEKPKPRAGQTPGTSTREVIAAARERIRTAVAESDRDALSDEILSLSKLTVRFVVHGGGPALDVALVADEAIDALNLVVAREVAARSGMHRWAD